MKILISVFLLVLACVANHSSAQNTAHLFIFSGQSNMKRLDPAERFTPRVVEEYGTQNVIVVKEAQGGQPIRRWYKGWNELVGNDTISSGDIYDVLMEKVNKSIAGIEPKTITFLWMQGEKDANEGNGEVYKAALKGLIQQLRTDMQRADINFVIGRLSDFDMDNSKYQDWTMIRDIQVEVAEEDSLADWVNTDDLNDGIDSQGREQQDALHYSVEGYKTFGIRLAESAIDLIKKK